MINNKAMKYIYIVVLIIVGMNYAMACTSAVRAERIPTNPIDCSMDLQVNIKGFLRLQVGHGRRIDKIVFKPAVVNGNNQTQNNPKFQPNKLAFSDSAPVAVSIVSNNGAITLTSTSTGFSNTSATGGNIPFSDITVDNLNGAITHPNINQAGINVPCTSFVGTPNCVTQLKENWVYKLAPSSNYNAGNYKATIVYKAVTP